MAPYMGPAPLKIHNSLNHLFPVSHLSSPIIILATHRAAWTSLPRHSSRMALPMPSHSLPPPLLPRLGAPIHFLFAWLGAPLCFLLSGSNGAIAAALVYAARSL